MADFRTFDSFESMMAFMEANRRAMSARVKPWQRMLTDYDALFLQDAGHDFPIFMQVVKSEYPEDEEVEAAMFFEDKRPVRAWSCICPVGELGIAHVATVFALVSGPAWLECQRQGWPDKIRGGSEGPFVLSYEESEHGVVPWVRLKSEVTEAIGEA
jgi:hypothetical protein